MKLTILVPSDSYRSSAGARIRYRRLTSYLKDVGVEVSLEAVRGFDASGTDCDVLLVSKCYDARALVAAAEVFSRRKLVGVDLFDDYFSATEDSRLLRYRSWLAQIMRFCDFAICSTQKMADITEQYRGGLPVHVLNDPAPPIGFDAIGPAVARKIARARADGVISIGWFGVGDNPFFAIGLTDLWGHGAMLEDIARSGMAVELTILTNRRALTADGLSLIEQLAVPKTVLEWSESAEQEFLNEMLAIFLPVSAEPFSVAKSLNRAVSALSAGCQVLSAGYPLYSALEPLLYRRSDDFVDDLCRGSLRLSDDTVGQYRRIVQRVASPKNEAARLARFLSGVKLQSETRSLPIALIHGHSTHPDSHHLVRAINGFSVASPYCAAPLEFDVVFRGTCAGLHMFVSRGAARRLLPDMRSKLKLSEAGVLKGYLHLSDKAEPPREKSPGMSEWSKAEAPFQLATYESAMADIEHRMTEAFGKCRIVISERSTLPFPALNG